jgi:RecJ-like exonuclease
VQCQQCHVSGNYQLTYTDCYQCHAADFQRPTNPNHVTLLFPHDCTLCHTQTVWTPSTYNHDTQFFRINSGAHRGRWTTCNQCHESPGNYLSFTCISCHEHAQPSMDSRHANVRNYQYLSSACYSCHRNV